MGCVQLSIQIGAEKKEIEKDKPTSKEDRKFSFVSEVSKNNNLLFKKVAW